MLEQEARRRLGEWRQITAEILYRMPDHRSLLQSFVWQAMDRWDENPRLAFPRLRQFCTWWNGNLDGPIVQVRVGALPLASGADLRSAMQVFRLH